jgi:hypothetical protein
MSQGIKPMNRLEAIKQIEEICSTTEMKSKGVEICKILFNQYIFEEFGMYPELPPQCVKSLNDKQKLEAVRQYRNATGLSLLECKRAVENYMMEEYGCDRFPLE